MRRSFVALMTLGHANLVPLSSVGRLYRVLNHEPLYSLSTATPHGLLSSLARMLLSSEMQYLVLATSLAFPNCLSHSSLGGMWIGRICGLIVGMG